MIYHILNSTISIQVNCFDLLKTIPDGYYDFGWIDPKYGISQNKSKPKTRGKLAETNIEFSFDDSEPITLEEIKEIQRVCKKWIFWGYNFYCEKPFEPPRRTQGEARKYKTISYEDFLALHPYNWVVWDKCNGRCNQRDCELAFTNLEIESYVFPFMWHGMMQAKAFSNGRKQQGNKKLNEKRWHSTQKPTKLSEYFFRKYTQKTDAILDPFMGSGSARISAIEVGRIYFGMEISPEIFQRSKEWVIDWHEEKQRTPQLF